LKETKMKIVKGIKNLALMACAIDSMFNDSSEGGSLAAVYGIDPDGSPEDAEMLEKIEGIYAGANDIRMAIEELTGESIEALAAMGRRKAKEDEEICCVADDMARVYAEDHGIDEAESVEDLPEDVQGKLKNAARQYVENGDEDANRSYWENMRSAIMKYVAA
jgi:hypothetical protein